MSVPPNFVVQCAPVSDPTDNSIVAAATLAGASHEFDRVPTAVVHCESNFRAIDGKTAGLLDERGHRLVVRNGFLPEREIMIGVGPVPAKHASTIRARSSLTAPRCAYTAPDSASPGEQYSAKAPVAPAVNTFEFESCRGYPIHRASVKRMSLSHWPLCISD